jgi:membrane-anchored mycosin MYCP
MAVIVASTAAVLAAPASPASAQDFDLDAWAKNAEPDKPVPCERGGAQGDSLPGTPWETVQMGLDEAHLHNTGLKPDGTPVVVAVIDSGVYADHPTFGGNVLPGADPWHLETKGHCDSAARGHGTGAAAIIAGGHDGLRFKSVAPDAVILPIRLFPEGDTDARSDGLSEMAADSIVAAVDAGADVINLSIAILDSSALHAAVKYAVERNVVIVAATGNHQINMDNPGDGEERTFYPAAYPETIAVAASNEHGNWGEFSNRGEAVDLLAPGVGVTLAAPNGSGYYLDSGTSFAAPYVSGAAALLKGYFGDRATPEFVRQRLIDTAVPPGNQHNIYQGYGLLNIRAALTAPLRIGGGDEEEPSVELSEIDFVQVPMDPLRTEKIWSLAAIGGVLLAIVLVLVFRKLLPGGHRRGWKPGTRQADPSI